MPYPNSLTTSPLLQPTMGSKHISVNENLRKTKDLSNELITLQQKVRQFHEKKFPIRGGRVFGHRELSESTLNILSKLESCFDIVTDGKLHTTEDNINALKRHIGDKNNVRKKPSNSLVIRKTTDYGKAVLGALMVLGTAVAGVLAKIGYLPILLTHGLIPAAIGAVVVAGLGLLAMYSCYQNSPQRASLSEAHEQYNLENSIAAFVQKVLDHAYSELGVRDNDEVPQGEDLSLSEEAAQTIAQTIGTSRPSSANEQYA